MAVEVGGSIIKKEDSDKKAIDEDENEAGHRPQSFEDGGQKAEAESSSNLDSTPEHH